MFWKGKLESFKNQYTNIGEYRKFNALQKYFEDETQIENLQERELTDVILDDLENMATNVLEFKKNHTEKGSAEFAAENFPTTSGLFYGNLEYDKYYYEDLQNLLEDITVVRNTTVGENEVIIYSCWY